MVAGANLDEPCADFGGVIYTLAKSIAAMNSAEVVQFHEPSVYEQERVFWVRSGDGNPKQAIQ